MNKPRKRVRQPKRVTNKVEPFYQCAVCGQPFATQFAAANCCGAWECGTCGGHADFKEEARNCCAEWDCVNCGETHYTLSEATACCAMVKQHLDSDNQADIKTAKGRKNFIKV